MIRFACPSCKSVMEAREDRAGKSFACPRCRKPIQVPGTPGAATARPRPVPRPEASGPTAAVAARLQGAAVAVASPAKPEATPTEKTPALAEQTAPRRTYLLVGGLVGGALLLLVLAIVGIRSALGTGETNSESISEVDVPEVPATPEGRAGLLARLQSSEMGVRHRAALELDKARQLDPSLVKPAISLLQERSDTASAVQMRKAGVRALGRLGPDAAEAVPYLRAATDDPNQEVRLLSVEALSKINNGPAIEALTDALYSKDPSVQLRTADTLGKCGPPAKGASAALLVILKEAEPEARLRIASALVKIDPTNKAVLPYLLAALEDTNDTNRRAAAIAIGEMGPNGKEAEYKLYDLYQLEANTEVRQAAENAYRKIGGGT